MSCTQWSEDEQTLLLELQSQFGSNWGLIHASYFPNRNPNQLKCKFNYLIHKKASPNDRLLRMNQKLERVGHSSNMEVQSFTEPKKQESQTESKTVTLSEDSNSFLENDLMLDFIDFE